MHGPCCKSVCGHWSVENRLHWVLDMAFREDENCIRTGHAAHNMSILRCRETITKRKQAGWNNGYLPRVLSNWNAIALGGVPKADVGQPL